jgi:LysM repeat protein
MEPEAPGTGSPSDHGAGHERGAPADHRAVTHDAPNDTGRSRTSRRPEVENSAVLASRRLCPYLSIDGGTWRSAVPDRDHRCGALLPMPPLTLDKQRRLCLTERHLTCSTFLAARGIDATGPDDRHMERPIVAVGPGRTPDLDTVTRWSIVRTTPVILDHSRVPVVGSLPRGRAAGQVGLAILLVAAFAALAIGRLSGPSGPTLGGAGQNSSPIASAPVVAAASPTPAPGTTATPAPTPTRTPKPSRTPTATGTPAPTASTAPVSTTYKVRNGDTLYGISIRFHTSVKAIQQLNHLNGTTLHIGQVLKIPTA